MKTSKKGLSYDDLTKDQKEFFNTYIFNGVGSDHYWLNPHDLIFKDPARVHDFQFYRGGNDGLRKKSNKGFLRRSLIEVNKQKIITRPFYFIVAYVYYGALVLFSKEAWEYYDAPAETWLEFIYRVKAAFDREDRDYPWGQENPDNIL